MLPYIHERPVVLPGQGSRGGWRGPGSDSDAPWRVWIEDKQVDPECESAAERRLLKLIAEHPDFRGLERQIFDVGGCEHPIRLSGATVRRLVATGEVVKYLASRDAPAGVILIRCMNRRASRCASCARLYQGDTYQLIRAGVAGGKGVPASVAQNPQVFATLTAPSFGAVHKAYVPGTKEVCRWRLPGAKCPHAVEYGCRARHEPGDPLVGQALCLQCYDYVGAVLFNACASDLWKALSDNLYHHLARHAGVSQREIRRLLHIEYVRVAEYQARGAVHFHLVLRIDGPDGVGSPAPAWASAQVLIAALGSARSVTKLSVPDGFGGVKVLRFGGQPQEVGEPIVFDASKGMTPEKVAGYLAKYTSKGTEDAHGSDVPIRHVLEIEDSGRTAHVRALMRTAWRLGGPQYKEVKEFEGLRRVCHMLGYRGNVCTTSRGYSVTRKALREARAAFTGRARIRRRWKARSPNRSMPMPGAATVIWGPRNWPTMCGSGSWNSASWPVMPPRSTRSRAGGPREPGTGGGQRIQSCRGAWPAGLGANCRRC